MARLIRIKQFGWDKNWQVYRYLIKGEKTRGVIIINPKKITQKKLNKLHYKLQPQMRR